MFWLSSSSLREKRRQIDAAPSGMRRMTRLAPELTGQRLIRRLSAPSAAAEGTRVGLGERLQLAVKAYRWLAAGAFM